MERFILSEEAREKHKVAITLKHNGHLTEAIEAYRDLVRMEPAFSNGWRQLGHLLKKTGESGAAQQTYETALSLDPSCATISNLATIYFESDQVSKAEKLLQEATASNGTGMGTCILHLELSHIYHMQKRWDETKACLLNAILADPSSVDTYYNLAHLYFALERWDDSLSVCMKILRIEPNHWNTHWLIRDVLNKTDRKKAADALYKKVSALKSKEDEIKRQWVNVVDQAQKEFNIPAFRFELFLPKDTGGK